jgi:hypothetical protein
MPFEVSPMAAILEIASAVMLSLRWSAEDTTISRAEAFQAVSNLRDEYIPLHIVGAPARAGNRFYRQLIFPPPRLAAGLLRK